MAKFVKVILFLLLTVAFHSIAGNVSTAKVVDEQERAITYAMRQHGEISAPDLPGKPVAELNNLQSHQISVTRIQRPKLPVANALWKAQPDLPTASEAWILAGGAHHTVFSHALDLNDMRQFAEMHDIEIAVIDNDTRLPAFKDALRWNEVYYGFKR